MANSYTGAVTKVVLPTELWDGYGPSRRSPGAGRTDIEAYRRSIQVLRVPKACPLSRAPVNSVWCKRHNAFSIKVGRSGGLGASAGSGVWSSTERRGPAEPCRRITAESQLSQALGHQPSVVDQLSRAVGITTESQLSRAVRITAEGTLQRILDQRLAEMMWPR